MYPGYLSHHGIKGMKWGIRRFQPYPKGFKKGKEVGEAKRKQVRTGDSNTLQTPKRKRGVRRTIERVKSKKENKKRIERLNEERERKQAEYERQREKERVLREGTATEVLKYKGELTTKELQDAAERIKWTNTLQSYSTKDINSALDKLSEYSKQLKKMNDIASTALTTRKNVDEILKIFNEKAAKSREDENKKKGNFK